MSSSSLSLLIQKGWESKYKDILRMFEFNRLEDEKSALMLASILKEKKDVTKNLQYKINNKNVIVVGPGCSLARVSYYLRIFSRYKNTTIIAADTAAKLLVDRKINPDITVTDLDGDRSTLFRLGWNGKTIMIVHAHSDNKPKLCFASRFKLVMGTTQSTPFDAVRNFGGFTDGDRCVFLAYHFGAKNIFLVGMDFDGQSVNGYFITKEKSKNATKKKKLKEAKRLLEWLAEIQYRNYSQLTNKRLPIVGLYSISKPPKGFVTINKDLMQSLLKKKN